MKYFSVGKQKKIIIRHSEHIKKPYNEWLTFGKLLLLNPAKTLYLYLRTWNTIPSFLHLFTNKTIFWFVFNLWSFQQTAQNKPLHYPLKSKLLPYWCTFSIIHSSIYLICYDIQKMKLSFNEQHTTTEKKRVLTHGIVLIYENPQKEGYI